MIDEREVTSSIRAHPQTQSSAKMAHARMSVGVFLKTAKKHLHQALAGKTSVTFVIGNESADLDSIASAVVYGYIQSSTFDAVKANKLCIPVSNIPAADLSLRPELTALLRHAGASPSDLITWDDLGPLPMSLADTNWTLVDHNVLQGRLGELYRDAVSGVIDHHDDEEKIPPTASPRIIEKSGSCSSLVTNYCREALDAIAATSTKIGASHGQDDKLVDDFAYTSTWDAQVAKLALAPILIDTVNFDATDKVTEHDRKAVKYLEARINISPRLGKDYDRQRFFTEINEAKSDLSGLSLDDILRKDYKQWTEGDLRLGMSSVVQNLEYLLEKKADDLVAELLGFAEKRKLHLFAVMTAYNTDSGGFARELLLLATAEGQKAAERFAQDCTTELQLETSQIKLHDGKEKAAWLRVWDARNLKASRKQVGPLIREAMR
nr:putative exopolyphosphatase [Quercus suber]